MKSVYIHIPFCSSLCTYCDFSKLLYFKKYINKYLSSLEYEINSKYKGEEIETIYIGGGTPSVLSYEELEYLFSIIKIFNKSANLEFTIECNVNDINEEKLKLFKKNNVNRISIGVQTFNQEVLKKMNREHDYKTVKDKIDLIKKIGIENINIDLIYAFPNTNILDLKKDLEKIFSLDIKHVSTYSLMIEPHTFLYINKVKNVSEELDLDMYNLVCYEMSKYGFNHYEVSNFCLPGYESKHNLTYWNNDEYYGFGLGASGYIDDIRYTNTLSLDKYLNHEYDGTIEKIALKDKKVYELILGFRKIKGIKISEFNKKYHENILENAIIKKLLTTKSLISDTEYIKIPEEKIYVQNEILEELLDYE